MIGIRGISMSVAAALICVAAGCAHNGAPAAAAPVTSAVPQSPADALAASVASLKQRNYAFTMTAPDLSAKGEIDGTTGRITIAAKYDGGETDTGDVVVVGAARYVRLRVQSKDFDAAKKSRDPAIRKAVHLVDGKTWIKVDPKKLQSEALNLYLDDPTGVVEVIKDAVIDSGTAQRITGHIDLPGSVPPQHGVLTANKISLQPFTATLDAQGHLLTFGDSAQPSHWGFTFTGYGQQQPATAPKGVQAVDPSMYQFINDEN
jgi:hypothetical protein